ncbi:hypothetical protein AOQ84DRAFT_440319 [Glonium stellatum]|uniref:Uncharacterized protein n=1 Tax=Glonium stellatum TaxID=574774 RepID=A0A8E2EYI3_9PEZI|nr:hypothetical protein AOQ84DRAFT_440319 [Glonium stellatum]
MRNGSSESVFCAPGANVLDEQLNGSVAASHIRAKAASGRPTHHGFCAHDTAKKAIRTPRQSNQLSSTASNSARLGFMFDHPIIVPSEILIANFLLLVSAAMASNITSFQFLPVPPISDGPRAVPSSRREQPGAHLITQVWPQTVPNFELGFETFTWALACKVALAKLAVVCPLLQIRYLEMPPLLSSWFNMRAFARAAKFGNPAFTRRQLDILAL